MGRQGRPLTPLGVMAGLAVRHAVLFPKYFLRLPGCQPCDKGVIVASLYPLYRWFDAAWPAGKQIPFCQRWSVFLWLLPVWHRAPQVWAAPWGPASEQSTSGFIWARNGGGCRGVVLPTGGHTACIAHGAGRAQVPPPVLGASCPP